MKPKNAILALILIFLVCAIFSAYIYYTHQFVLKTADSLKEMEQEQEPEEKTREQILAERKQIVAEHVKARGTTTPMTPEEKQADIERKKEIIKALLSK